MKTSLAYVICREHPESITQDISLLAIKASVLLELPTQFAAAVGASSESSSMTSTQFAVSSP